MVILLSGTLLKTVAAASENDPASGCERLPNNALPPAENERLSPSPYGYMSPVPSHNNSNHANYSYPSYYLPKMPTTASEGVHPPSPQKVVVMPSSFTADNGMCNKQLRYMHIDIEMSNGVCSLVCNSCRCKKRKNAVNGYNNALTAYPFRFRQTGSICVSNNQILVDNIQCLNKTYSKEMPFLCSPLVFLIFCQILPFIGTLLVLGGCVQLAVENEGFFNTPLLWVGLLVVVPSIIYTLLFELIFSNLTKNRLFKALHDECCRINKELKNEMVRFDFLACEKWGDDEVYATNKKLVCCSALYINYFVRITDLKQPI